MIKPQNEKRTLLLSAAVAMGLVFCIYFAMGVWPFGINSVLTGDLNGQYISYNANFARAILDGGDGMAYSLQKQMGGSMMGILSYYCASPLNLLYLLVPTQHYAKMAGLIFALKIIFSAVSMTFFVGRHNINLRHRAIIPGICYAFCAYMFVYAQNIMWMDALVLLPLICYGIDVIIDKKRPFIFAISLGIAILANFYIAYMVCVFVVLYFGYCMILSYKKCVIDEKCTTIKFWLERCKNFTIGALCAGAFAGVLLVPALIDINSNKGFAEGFAITGETSFKFTEFFYRLMPFQFTWEDLESGLPNVYTGCAIIVLCVLFFFIKGIKIKEKLLSFAMLAIIFLMMYSADIALAMHGFVAPVWFLYRHAFLFVFWLCFMAARALNNSFCLNRKKLIFVLALLFGFLAICFFVRNTWYTATYFAIGAFICVFLLGAFFVLLMAKKRKIRAIAFVLICALVLGEAFANAFQTVNQFEKYPENAFNYFVKTGENTLEKIDEYINEDENGLGEDAYRTEKVFWRSYNDPLLLNYNGLSHFGSTQDLSVNLWLTRLGYGSANAFNNGSTAFADSINGVRYIFSREENSILTPGLSPLDTADIIPTHFEKISSQDDITISENKTALPIAFFVPLTVQESEFEHSWHFTITDTFDIQNMFFKDLSLYNDELFTDAEIDIFYDGAKIENNFPIDLVNGEVPSEFYDSAQITAIMPKDGILYATFESGQNRPVLLSDNAQQSGYFGGYPSGAVSLGRHKQGDEISISLTPEWGVADLSDIRLSVLDESLLYEYYNDVVSNSSQIVNDIQTSAQTITVNAICEEEQNLLMLSIPYSENLSLTINDEKAEIIPVFDNSFCAVLLGEGEHEIKIQYQQSGFYIGLLISCLGIISLMAYYFYMKKSMKKV